jgi:hypothetical protein
VLPTFTEFDFTCIVFEDVAVKVKLSTVLVDEIVPRDLKFEFLKFQDVEAAFAKLVIKNVPATAIVVIEPITSFLILFIFSFPLE